MFDKTDAKIGKIYFAEQPFWLNFANKTSHYMIQVDKAICPHNHVCPLIKLCPVGAITQDADGYPVIDYSLCIECGKCVRSCPKKAMKQTADASSSNS